MLKYKLKKLPPTTNSVVLYTFVELLTIKAINISNILNHNKVKKKKTLIIVIHYFVKLYMYIDLKTAANLSFYFAKRYLHANSTIHIKDSYIQFS